MNQMQVFENKDFGSMRTMMKNGEPWFVAADVCKALELMDTGKATGRLEEDELTRIKFESGGQMRDMIAVNEPGLYSLVLGSRKPEAKAFKRWITHEVLPAIRKTGSYIAGEEALTDDELLARALQVMQNKLTEREARLNHLEAENSRLVVANQIAAPKAEYFDELVERNTLTSFRDTAKELKIKEKLFVGFLLEHKYIYRDKKGRLMPMAGRGDGLFEVKESYNEKTKWSGVQTMITPKGRETFRLLMQGLVNA